MKRFPSAIRRATLFALLLLGFIAFNVSRGQAQSVAGGTQISNRVAITYTEPTGSTVNGVSNTVTITVSNVTGLVITPDNGTPPGVNGGQSGVTRTFTISNTGNITESIQFGSSGASLVKTGSFTVTQAFVDVDGNGSFSAGDVDILSTVGPVSMPAGTSLNVIVKGDVPANAPQGSTITLTLGDVVSNGPSHDNVPATASAAAVKTVGSTGINGNLEAGGNMSFTVLATGNVLLGPQGHPDAVGPTSNMDDYTNKTMTAGISVPFGGVTTAGGVLTFTNTIRSAAAAVDNVVLTATNVPTGFQVEVSSGGGPYTHIEGAGQSATVAVPASSDLDISVRITAPSGINVLTGFSTVLRATSGITPQSFNETIDRLWSGFIRADKSVSIQNATGIGSPTDPVPGAVITYTVTYTNVTATAGTNNANLTATNVVLTEDGNSAPNNWATTTNEVVGSATDSLGGAITGDSAGSNLLTDTVASIGPGQSGTFVFKRTIH